MSTELREAIVVGIECLLFSLILFIIFIFSGYSKDALNIKHTQDLAMTDITEYRNIYQFTEGKEFKSEDLKNIVGDFPNIILSNSMNDGSKLNKIGHLLNPNCVETEDDYKEIKLLNGDDIVRFVGLYPKEYNITIINGAKTLKLYKNSSTQYIESSEDVRTKLSNDWEISNVSAWLGQEIVNKFYCIISYDDLTNQYDSVIFLKQ